MWISAQPRRAPGQGDSMPSPRSPPPQDARQDAAHKTLPASPADGLLSSQTFCFLLPPQRQAKQQPQPFWQEQLCQYPSPMGSPNQERYPTAGGEASAELQKEQASLRGYQHPPPCRDKEGNHSREQSSCSLNWKNTPQQTGSHRTLVLMMVCLLLPSHIHLLGSGHMGVSCI